MKCFTKEEGSLAYVNFLKKYLQEGSEAYLWASAFTVYIHDIDDIVDDEIPDRFERNEFFLRTLEFAEVVYANIFYLKHINELRPLVKMASNTYMDSVILEKQPEQWKRLAADSLRNMGNEIILACIEIVGGMTLRRTASLELREISYKTHHDDTGNPI